MNKLIYLNRGGDELHNPKRTDIELMSRRSAIRRATVFLPLSVFLASRIRAKANSFIINRTIAAASQNAISMSQATWGRPVTLPVGWSKIRLGCRLHWTNTAANLTANPIFTFGFNSGTALQYGDATTQNFGGLALDTATWTYNAGGTSYYSFGSGVQLFRMRVGTSNTDVAALSSSGSYFNAGAGTNSADRQIWFFDVTKGSPYVFKQPFGNLIAQPDDVSATNFLLFMSQLAPVPGGNYGAAGPTGNLSIDEAGNGTWNAINFFWNRSDVTVEICDIAVAVLA